MFAIYCLSADDVPPPMGNTEERIGEIVLDDFKEKFVIPLDFWSIDQYQAHWIQGIERITKGAFKSCLITALYAPQIAHHIFWWIIYREGQKCIFQNQMFILNNEERNFDPSSPYPFIQDRQTYTEDGLPISEWEIQLDEMEKFLENLKRNGKSSKNA
jgi:hypothetical protein